MIIIDLIYKLSLLVAFGVLSGFINSKYDKSGLPGKILQGVLFGIAGCISIYQHFIFQKGIIFDGRSIVISLCSLFFGPVAGLIASFFTLVYRIMVGGSGMIMGILVILSSFLIGYFFHVKKQSASFRLSWVKLYLFGIIVHVVMLIFIFTLPGKYIVEAYKEVSLTVIGVYPVISLLIGRILWYEEEKMTSIDQIRESEERYRRLLEVAPVGIAVHSENLISFINPTGAHILGADSDVKIIGKPLDLIIHPVGLKDSLNRFHRLMQGEKGLYPVEDVFIRLDGSALHVEVMASSILYKGTPAVQFIFADMTQRKKAENDIKMLNANLEKRIEERTAQLQETNNELEAFTYSVSHDLRAPLRAIDGFARFLAEDYGKVLDEEGRRIVHVIRHNSKHMGQLIDDLLTFSKLGRTEIVFSGVQMNRLVESVYVELTDVESRKRINFQCGELLDAKCDEAMIRQVWTNLISNSIKYSSKREIAEISITCASDGDRVVYCIKDHGAGFDMKFIERLFGVFQRLHSPRDFEGTGVGLAIVKRIIQKQGGKVWAEGEIGKGASFYFSLPV